MKNNIKYSIISGSTRENSQSRKVSDYIFNKLKVLEKSEINLIDLAIEKFPLWDESIWINGPDWNPIWSNISNKLHKSDAIIIVVPEWNGMMPPQLTNFFQLCSNNELSYKPGLIVSVSTGLGGAYPIAELRMASYKNTKICYIPDHVIIRNVNEVLNHNEEVNGENDQVIRNRISNSLTILNLYADATRGIRDHSLIVNSKFLYGM